MIFLNKGKITVTLIVLLIAAVACQKASNSPLADKSLSKSSEVLKSTAIDSKDTWLPALISRDSSTHPLIIRRV